MSSESSQNSGAATAERTAVYNSSDPHNSLLSVNMGNIPKLTNTNYLMWSKQIHALLEGHELHSFLVAPDAIPTATTETNGVAEPNPAFVSWRRQDRLLYSAVLGALLGKPMDPEDLIEQVLAGFPEEYKPEIDATNGRDNLISFTELHEKLVNREAMILCAQPSSPAFPITANQASRSKGNNNNNNNNWRNQTPQQHQQQQPMQGQQQQNRNYTRQSRPYLGKCQACGVQGHIAQRCPLFRVVPTQNSTSSEQQWRPSANQVALNTTNTEGWLMDSGATNHVTSDFHNLSLHNPYTGNDSIVVGNGAALPITHTGSFHSHTPNRNYTFNNVLCVPSIHKNLISVYQFCNDNQTSVPSMFQVKDLDTGAPLLKGLVKDGSYEWPYSSSLGDFSVSKSSLSHWHHRLGHPAFPILKTITSSFLSSTLCNALESTPCNSCLLNKSHKLPFSTTTISSTHPL